MRQKSEDRGQMSVDSSEVERQKLEDGGLKTDVGNFVVHYKTG